MALHWFGEYLSSFGSPQGFFGIRQCHRLSGNWVVRLFMPAAGAKPKENKITWSADTRVFSSLPFPRWRKALGTRLMDCICLCCVKSPIFRILHSPQNFKIADRTSSGPTACVKGHNIGSVWHQNLRRNSCRKRLRNPFYIYNVELSLKEVWKHPSRQI